MSFMKGLGAVSLAVALSLAAPLSAQTVKIALDSAKDLENSGSYVWAHTFSEYLNANGMEAEEYDRGALGGEAEKMDQVQQGLLEAPFTSTRPIGAWPWGQTTWARSSYPGYYHRVFQENSCSGLHDTDLHDDVSASRKTASQPRLLDRGGVGTERRIVRLVGTG